MIALTLSRMQRSGTVLPVLALTASLLVFSGCMEGTYQYQYSGYVLRQDGRTPAEGVRIIAQPASREGIFGAQFSADDPNLVVSGANGRFSGTMRGWWSTPLLWPFAPQECKANKVWVYLPEDSGSGRWKAVVLPARLEKADRPCTGTIADLRVVLPNWYVSEPAIRLAH